MTCTLISLDEEPYGYLHVHMIFYVQEDIDVQNEENDGVESFADNISQVWSKLLDVIQ